MTLDEIIEIARNLSSSDREELREYGEGVFGLLTEVYPSGLEAPTVVRGDDDGPWINVDWLNSEVTPKEARSMARMLLQAADEADSP